MNISCSLLASTLQPVSKLEVMCSSMPFATLTQIAGMVNVTYGTHILARDVYNRTYDHHE
ncbi:hypothetical protein V1515DRAFT_581377 [Lipomyces mesembrius]